MSCPKCGSNSPAQVIIEKSYDGAYDFATGLVKVDWLTCCRETMVVCPDCGEDYPSTCISNPEGEV